jgi:rhodanese-related sulfurtransferase
MSERFEKLVAETKKHITEIPPTEAAAKMKSGEAAVVNVREKDEWDEEHMPDAIHLSRGTIELEIEDKIKDICKSTS